MRSDFDNLAVAIRRSARRRESDLDSPPSPSRGKICGLEDIAIVVGKERSKNGNGYIKYGSQGQGQDVSETQGDCTFTLTN